jgi:NAD-dependent dihydropyrimidine dehydrogenase PreA subunit
VVTLTYVGNGATLTLRPELCIGCGMCVDVCPHRVFVVGAGKAAIARREQCMECGGCALNCAPGAISVRAGVGCAYAIIGGLVRGGAPSCGGSCGGDAAASCSAVPDQEPPR